MKDGQKFNPYNLFTGLFIPEWLARSKEVSAGAKLAYGRLVRYAGENGLAFPSMAKLAAEIGYDVRQTQRYVAELQSVGLIDKVARVSEIGQTSNLYEFVWQDRLMSPGPLSELTPPPVSELTPKESHIEESHFERHTYARVSPPRVSDLNGLASQRFQEFWGKYPRKQRKDFAASNFVSYVTVDTETATFACLDRYLRSAEVGRGIVMNPDKWLLEQHATNWEGDWPAREKTLHEMIEEMPDD